MSLVSSCHDQRHHEHIVVNPIQLAPFSLCAFNDESKLFVQPDGRLIGSIGVQLDSLQTDPLRLRDRPFRQTLSNPLPAILAEHTHAKASNMSEALLFIRKDVAPSNHLLAVESHELGNPARDGRPHEFANRVRWRRVRQRQITTLLCDGVETGPEAFNVLFRHWDNPNIFTRLFHSRCLNSIVARDRTAASRRSSCLKPEPCLSSPQYRRQGPTIALRSGRSCIARDNECPRSR